MLILYASILRSPQNQDKLQSIYYAYRHSMAHAAMAILHNHHDAEDAVQQAFLCIARNIHALGDPADPKTRAYALITAEHKAIDILRKRRPELPLEEEKLAGIPIPMPEDTGLSAALSRLPARYRQVLLLRYDTGLSAREIAKALNLTQSNVQKLMWRGKQLLRKELEKEDTVL